MTPVNIIIIIIIFDDTLVTLSHVSTISAKNGSMRSGVVQLCRNAVETIRDVVLCSLMCSCCGSFLDMFETCLVRMWSKQGAERN